MQLEYGIVHVTQTYCTASNPSIALQENYHDMTREQLDSMWQHFRVLDPDRVNFAKPPSTWRPPAFKDMNPDQLSAFWNGFRQIMHTAAEKVPVQDVDSASFEPKETVPDIAETKAIVSAAPAAEASTALQPVLRRIKGKTSPALLGMGHSKGKGKGKGQDKDTSKRQKANNTKRKYNKKACVTRDGKNSSVSIWNKVQLFKDSHPC